MTTPEEFQTKIASDFLVEVFKESIKGLKSFKDWISDSYKANDPLGIAISKYRKKSEDNYGTIRIFCMPKPVLLRSIFVNVNILDYLTGKKSRTIADLQFNFLHNKRLSYHDNNLVEGSELLNLHKKVIVYGKPGAGKTTYLKRLFLYALDDSFSFKKIPVFITLKGWSDANVSLIEYISSQFSVCDFPEAKPFVEKILEKGDCIILLDGYDEITNNLYSCTSEIEDFVLKYSENHFIITCRIASREHIFEKFTEVEIADLKENQIKQFIDNWFGHNSPKASNCYEKIISEKHFSEMATIPLLLTMLCVTFDELYDFPTNRAELYKEAIDALLKKWDSSRSIKRDALYKKLSLKRKEDLLSQIAYKSYTKKQFFLKQNTVEQYIADYIKNIPSTDEKSIEIDSTNVLKSIEAQHGLLVERAKYIYSFSHLTFQEYYTAVFIYNNNLVKEAVDMYLGDHQWHEIFTILCSMLPDSKLFFEPAMNKLKNIQPSPKIADDVEEMIFMYKLFYKNGFAMKSLELIDSSTFLNKAECARLVKNVVVKQQTFEIAAAFRDMEKDYIEKLSEEEYTEYKKNSYGTYISYLDIIKDCLNSDCYLSNKNREEYILFMKNEISQKINAIILESI